MSALLLRWLNEELTLHRQVEVLERDLSNGYLVAEVLHGQGLEPKLDDYEDASTTAAKIHNMELLGERLERLGMPFPVNTRRAIMMEDRTTVLQFLLQLKEFLRPRPKARASNFKANAAIPRRSVSDASHGGHGQLKLPPRDVEERFVEHVMKELRPKEVRFYKQVDMAVHLRKFDQMQWQAENELNDFQEHARADKSAASAAQITSVRTHLRDKAQFMRDWDHEHHEKWKHTQRLYLDAERDDLRLELTLAARRRIAAEIKLTTSQQDASSGVVEFEKNMNRLGLASSGNEQRLEAIPASDAGALAHFHSLEKRVEDLDFRPSNNVKMMKELRKRRKAQLAAEKDRRMRRQKALADQKKSIQERESERRQSSTFSIEQLPDEAKKAIRLLVPSVETMEPVEPPGSFQDKYLESKREKLEENYARLRESGSAKREEDRKTLDMLRLETAKKEAFRKWDVCADAVEALISLSVALASPGDNESFDARELKTRLFLRLDSSSSSNNDHGSHEQFHELSTSVNNFLASSEVWASLPLQSSLDVYDWKSDLKALAEAWMQPSEAVALDTSWSRPPSFVLVSVATQDEVGTEIAGRVAHEHHLTLLQVEHVADECVKMTYDPQKLGEQVATLSDRERELGVFGHKISSLRQKSTPFPETLAVEIMAVAISLCRREVLASVSGENAVSSANSPGGCMLLNFPRTLEEARLLENALGAGIPEENEEEDGLASSRSKEEAPTEVGESDASKTTTTLDCVVSISAVEVPPSADGDEGNALQGSDSTASLSEKRPSTAKQTAIEAQQKLLAEEERTRNYEHRLALSHHWDQTARHLKMDQNGLHRDVIVETIHLWIQVFTQAPLSEATAAIECKDGDFPQQLISARDERRTRMDLCQRVLWLRVSKEINVPDGTFEGFVKQLDKIDRELSQRFRQPLSEIRTALRTMTAMSVAAQDDLERQLRAGDNLFQGLLDRATESLRAASSSSQRERSLTELEVSLGDIADFNRVQGNKFVDSLASDPLPPAVGAVDVVYRSLPTMCFLLKSHAMQKLELLQTQLYAYVPFLRDSVRDAGREVVLPKTLTNEAMSAATKLGGTQVGGEELAQTVGEKVLRVLGQVATEFTFHLADDSPAEQYMLHERQTTSAEVQRLLQQMVLLCRFADRLRETASHLYEGDLIRLRQTIQDDFRHKDEAISAVMEGVRTHGQASWPARGPSVTSEARSAIAVRLPRVLSEQFLSMAQISALAQTCRDWESSRNQQQEGNCMSSNVDRETFVALVLEVATKTDFPVRWRDAGAIAGVTLQQCSPCGGVSWRMFIWTLLCIGFMGIPSLEDVLEYHARVQALPPHENQEESQQNQQTAGDSNSKLTVAQFWKLPLWFEQPSESRPTWTEREVEELKTLLLLLFATECRAAEYDGDAGATAVNHVEVLPMLLCWCAYPPSSFDIRPELATLLPRYSRGLFRAFQLLNKHPATHEKAATHVSALLAVAGSGAAEVVDGGESELGIREQLVECFSREAAADPESAFLAFSSACDENIVDFLELRNPFEALIQS